MRGQFYALRLMSIRDQDWLRWDGPAMDPTDRDALTAGINAIHEVTGLRLEIRTLLRDVERLTAIEELLRLQVLELSEATS